MNIYLIWGRVPGAHEDTTYIIAAGAAISAEDQFTDLVHEDYSAADLDAADRAHGVTIFINGCELIGGLIEVGGEKLIRPEPGAILGI